MAKMMFRSILLTLFLLGMLYTNTHGMSLVKRDADVEEGVAEEGEGDAEGEEASEAQEGKDIELEEEIEAEAGKDFEAEKEAEAEAEAKEDAEEESEEEAEEAENDKGPSEDENEEAEAESVPEEEKDEQLGGDVEPEKIPESDTEEDKEDESALVPDISDSEETPKGDEEESVPEESGEGDSDSTFDSSDKWPFSFDSPFFSFEQVENYFKDLERAIQRLYRRAMEVTGSVPKTYENSQEKVIEINGRKFLVHNIVVLGADEKNGVSIEAVAIVPMTKRRKWSHF